MIDTFLRTIGMTIGTFLIPMARPADPVKHVSTRRRLTIEFGPSLELISALLKQKNFYLHGLKLSGVLIPSVVVLLILLKLQPTSVPSNKSNWYKKKFLVKCIFKSFTWCRKCAKFPPWFYFDLLRYIFTFGQSCFREMAPTVSRSPPP